MGIYEWCMLSGMLLITLTPIVIVAVLEIRKNNKLIREIEQEILHTRIRLWTKLVSGIISFIVLIGGVFVTIYCSIVIQLPTKSEFAILMGVMIIALLICFFSFFCICFRHVRATEKGIWVSNIFLKPKFYLYEEITRIEDNSYLWNGGYLIYRENGRKICTIRTLWDTHAQEMVSLLRERSKCLKPWDARENDDFEEIFPL